MPLRSLFTEETTHFRIGRFSFRFWVQPADLPRDQIVRPDFESFIAVAPHRIQKFVHEVTVDDWIEQVDNWFDFSMGITAVEVIEEPVLGLARRTGKVAYYDW